MAGDEIGWGRFVLLYDPAGQDGWAGPFRVIAYVRAELEPEIAADPLIGQVGWSWLTEALEARSAGYAAPSGTVTRVVTEGFGTKQEEPVATEFEMRASWSPTMTAGGIDGHSRLVRRAVHRAAPAAAGRRGPAAAATGCRVAGPDAPSDRRNRPAPAMRRGQPARDGGRRLRPRATATGHGVAGHRAAATGAASAAEAPPE